MHGLKWRSAERGQSAVCVWSFYGADGATVRNLAAGWMCGAWLSIDLGESVQVETVDVLGALEAGTIGSYPEVKGGDMLAPFAVVLLDQEDRRSKPREDKDQNARLYGREGRNREPAEPKIEDEHVQWAGAGHSFVSGKVYLEEEGSLSENMYLLPAGGVRASQVAFFLTPQPLTLNPNA